MAVRGGGPLRRALSFHVPLAVMVVGTLFPFYWMVITAIRPDTELYNVQANPFFTFHPTLQHFRDLFDRTMFGRWAWNTFLTSGGNSTPRIAAIVQNTLIAMIARYSRLICSVAAISR